MVMAALALTLTSWAEPRPMNGFTATGYGTSSFITNAVISANCANGGPAVITFLAATGQNADNTINVWVPTTAIAQVVNVNATVKIPVVRTNGIAAGDTIIIRHRATDTYDIRIVDTMAESTNVVTTVAAATCANGDLIYKVTNAGGIVTGTSAQISNAGGLVYSPYPGPVALILTGTTAASKGITAVSGYYQQP